MKVNNQRKVLNTMDLTLNEIEKSQNKIDSLKTENKMTLANKKLSECHQVLDANLPKIDKLEEKQRKLKSKYHHLLMELKYTYD